ncbi:MAG: ABC transporter permease [Bacillota bacterium]
MKTSKRWLRFAIRSAFPLLAILSALAVGGLMLMIVGYDVGEVGSSIWMGIFGSKTSLALTLNKSTPLILLGAGVAIAFKGSSFNIGAEGQFFAGALGCALCEAALKGAALPSWLRIVLILATAVVFGGVYGAIPGYLKARHGSSEVVTSVMLSSVMILFVSFMVNGPIQEPNKLYSETPEIAEAARLPYIWEGTKLHPGILIAIVLVVVLYFVLEKTTFGFKIKAAGQSAKAAEYAGINPNYITISTFVISGAAAGLAGAIEVLGVSWKLYLSISPGYGYNAIAVALLAQLNPLLIVLSGLLFGALNTGCNQMSRMIGVPSALSSLLQALVLLFVIAYMPLQSRFERWFMKGRG